MVTFGCYCVEDIVSREVSRFVPRYSELWATFTPFSVWNFITLRGLSHHKTFKKFVAASLELWLYNTPWNTLSWTIPRKLWGGHSIVNWWLAMFTWSHILWQLYSWCWQCWRDKPCHTSHLCHVMSVLASLSLWQFCDKSIFLCLYKILPIQNNTLLLL